jgi:MinD-like ATPase involved in chromosome partitioning or flagellar assembly
MKGYAIMIAINVYSPKGGVGTTTISSMLALDLSKHHYVGLVSRDPDASCAVLGYPTSPFPYKLNHGLIVSNEMIPDVDFTIMDSRAHVAAADINILVVQNTYMSLRKALNCQFDLLVANIIASNALSLEDIKSTMSATNSVTTQIAWDQQAARTLDAGLASNFLKREDFQQLVKRVDQAIKQDAPF